MKKLALIHATASAVAPMQDAFLQEGTSFVLENFVDESIFTQSMDEEGIPPYMLRRFAKLVFTAAERGAEGIIVCCSIYCPYIHLVAPFLEIPIWAVDTPMLERAASEFHCIGLIATNPASITTSGNQLRRLAESQGQSPEIRGLACGDAMSLRKAGDVAGHDRIIREGAEQLKAEGCDCIILAQLTMAHVGEQLEKLGIPVFSSAKECIRVLGSEPTT